MNKKEIIKRINRIAYLYENRESEKAFSELIDLQIDLEG